MRRQRIQELAQLIANSLDPQGNAETNDFEPEDVWYFPRGHGHQLECLGDKPTRFILIFDNGYFSEFGTFRITDWIGHTPKPLLAKNFGVPESTFDGFPTKKLYFARGSLPPEKPATPLQGQKLPLQTHKWRLLAQAPIVDNKGGRLWLVDSHNFAISKTIKGAILDLDPGALRELHWHLTRRNLAALAAERGDRTGAGRLWREVLAECPGDRDATAKLRVRSGAVS